MKDGAGKARANMSDPARWDKLASILMAIKENHPLPPISVNIGADNIYSISNGHHRFVASNLFKFKYIPVVVDGGGSDQKTN